MDGLVVVGKGIMKGTDSTDSTETASEGPRDTIFPGFTRGESLVSNQQYTYEDTRVDGEVRGEQPISVGVCAMESKVSLWVPVVM